MGDLRAAILSVAFVVDQGNISRAGGDFLEPLVFAAIVQANLAALRHDPELQRRYADTGEILPDELRRPISAFAIAESLRLPYETVRRRVHRLVDQGLCVMSPAGAYVPGAAIAAERHAAIQRARMQRLVRFEAELVEAGVLEPDAADLAAAPVRAANTALAQYMLRTCERLNDLMGDLVDGFVLLGLVAASREGLLAAEPSARSIRASALAARLGMANETVRRRLPVLAKRGYARRVTGGWISAAPAADRERIARMAAENEADVRRLLARVRSLASA